jgi:hypothetical protein
MTNFRRNNDQECSIGELINEKEIKINFEELTGSMFNLLGSIFKQFIYLSEAPT